MKYKEKNILNRAFYKEPDSAKIGLASIKMREEVYKRYLGINYIELEKNSKGRLVVVLHFYMLGNEPLFRSSICMVGLYCYYFIGVKDVVHPQ